jgi:ferredoxin-NADP reductase
MTEEIVPGAFPSRRIKELEVMVADVVIETPDTTTLVLFTGNDRLDYRAGHFLTIDPHQFEALERFTAFLEDLKGKRELPRAYSMCSAPHERASR